MSETMSFAVRFSLIGIFIVFMALAIIALVVSLIRRANERWIDREDDQREKATEKEPTIDTITMVLISAAVATMLQGRYHIRKIRRLMPAASSSSSWSLEGRAILHGSHVVPKKR